jgi:hypothetical protein
VTEKPSCSRYSANMPTSSTSSSMSKTWFMATG